MEGAKREQDMVLKGGDEGNALKQERQYEHEKLSAQGDNEKRRPLMPEELQGTQATRHEQDTVQDSNEKHHALVSDEAAPAGCSDRGAGESYDGASKCAVRRRRMRGKFSKN